MGGDIPEGSRASKAHGFLKPAHVTDDKLAKVRRLNDLARQRGQTLAQMALAWTLRFPEITSTLIGASRVELIDDAAGALAKGPLSDGELKEIDGIWRVKRRIALTPGPSPRCAWGRGEPRNRTLSASLVAPATPGLGGTRLPSPQRSGERGTVTLA